MVVQKKSLSRTVFNILNYSFFTLFTLLCIYPFWYVICYSLSIPERATNEGVSFWPVGFTLTNFQQVFALNGLFHALLISVLRTVIGTLCTVVTCMWLGYVFTKEKMPARKFFYRFMIITMYIGGGMIPTYLVYRAYGLLNKFAVYILPAMVSAYYVILIKTFVEQLPPSLEESAVIDGAGPLTIFFRIILPLSMPIAATIAIFTAVGQWNSWFDNHIYTFSNQNLTTLQYMLYNYLNEASRLAAELKNNPNMAAQINRQNVLTPNSVRMTITMITVLPVLLIYPFFQRYIVKGIMIGAVKG
ncbi:MAG: carbohydrate ABC transporter permease [Oscillospiraceae bacterium]|nr:carbohydrate ABC transporter permease [Oscillospiraceae bacterium]